MSLNVLVVESDRHAADGAVHDLTDAGYVVLRCHEPGEPTFPCRGVADRAECPLQSHVVDVALTVRFHARSRPTEEESGARCALMHRVPLVVAGPAVLDPYDGYEARVVDRTDDVVRACEEVAAEELVQHTAVANAALLASRTPDAGLAKACASVTRRRGRLLVTVHGLAGVARPQRDAAVVRVMAKIREFDASTRGIDIVVGPTAHDDGLASGTVHST